MNSFPKDDTSTHWTSHVKRKMMFYGLSENKIKNIIRNPKREEDGIAPDTLVVMQRNDKLKRKEEVWVMYAKSKGNKFSKPKMIIVSAWRYPGITKVKEKPQVPDDVMKELEKFMAN